MSENPVIIDVLMNLLGFGIAICIGNYLWVRKKGSVHFSTSVGLFFAALYFYIAARCFHMNFRLVLSSQGIVWERANVYLFWAFVAASAALYFYLVNKPKTEKRDTDPVVGAKTPPMKALRFVLGTLSICIAIASAKVIPQDWQSTDPKAKRGAVFAIIFTIVTGASGAVLLNDCRKNR
jgi:hypothetical protein